MKKRSYNDRRISICFYDFSKHIPLQFSRKLEVTSYKKGDVVGKKSIIRKNSLTVSLPLAAEDTFDDSLLRLFKLFKKDGVSRVIKALSPKESWVQLDIPAKGSTHQESKYVGVESIRMLSTLNLGLGIEIFEFDASNETH